MPVESAGILLYRFSRGELEVLLVHPGGPFWARKDEGAWSIPKGMVEAGEAAEDAARREFHEETGGTVAGPLTPLGQFRQSGGKIVIAFACEGEFDPAALVSSTFSMPWPPRSGRTSEFPEVDRAGWFAPAEAERKLLAGQRPILVELLARLS